MVYILCQSLKDAENTCARMEKLKIISPGWSFRSGEIFVQMSAIRWSALILRHAETIVDVLYNAQGRRDDYYVMDEDGIRAQFSTPSLIMQMFHYDASRPRQKQYMLFGFDAKFPSGHLAISGYCMRNKRRRKPIKAS